MSISLSIFLFQLDTNLNMLSLSHAVCLSHISLLCCCCEDNDLWAVKYLRTRSPHLSMFFENDLMSQSGNDCIHRRFDCYSVCPAFALGMFQAERTFYKKITTTKDLITVAPRWQSSMSTWTFYLVNTWCTKACFLVPQNPPQVTQKLLSLLLLI